MAGISIHIVALLCLWPRTDNRNPLRREIFVRRCEALLVIISRVRTLFPVAPRCSIDPLQHNLTATCNLKFMSRSWFNLDATRHFILVWAGALSLRLVLCDLQSAAFSDRIDRRGGAG